MLKRRIIDEGIYFIKTILGIAVLMVLTVALSSILSGALQEQELLMVENEEVLPVAVLELVGMQQLQVFPPQLEIFFLMLMVTNLIVMGLVIGHSVHRMRESYEKGALAFFYVQKMRMWQFYLMTIARIVFSALIVWSIYVTEVFLASKILCRSVEEAVLVAVLPIIHEMSVRGLVIIVLMASLGILYGIRQNYKMHGVDYGICLMALGFVVGNAYKIPQFIGQKQIEEMVNAQDMMQLAYNMKQVRVACPFAWLNPFNIYHNVLAPDVLGIYVLLAVVVLAIAGALFWRRDWWEL